MSEETKKCPYCAETIQAAAVVCRHCGRDLPQAQPKKKDYSLAIAAIVIVVALGLFALVQSGKTQQQNAIDALKNAAPEQSAWTSCTLFIQKQLNISYLDSQKYNAAGVSVLGNGQYQVKVFYPKQGQIYQCTVEHVGDNWKLIDLSLSK